MKAKIGPSDPRDSRPDTYWDGGGMVKGDAQMQRVLPASPAGLVGEYLPDLEEDEVEIVMIGMHSAMGDVISVRARRADGKIHYRVVDESENGYGYDGPGFKFSPAVSDRPLTYGELTNLLWSIEYDETGHCFKSSWQSSAESGDLPDTRDGFFCLNSDFYSDLDFWLDKSYDKWVEEKKTGFQIIDGSTCPYCAKHCSDDDCQHFLLKTIKNESAFDLNQLRISRDALAEFLSAADRLHTTMEDLIVPALKACFESMAQDPYWASPMCRAVSKYIADGRFDSTVVACDLIVHCIQEFDGCKLFTAKTNKAGDAFWFARLAGDYKPHINKRLAHQGELLASAAEKWREHVRRYRR